MKEKVKNEDAGENAEGDREPKEEVGSPTKMAASPEKQSPGLRRFPQKYEKLRIDHVAREQINGDNLKSIKRDADEAMFLPFYN